MLRASGETEEQLEERRQKKVEAGAWCLLAASTRAPRSFESAFSSTPLLTQYTLYPPFNAGRATAHGGSYALTVTFTPNSKARARGVESACSVPASLKKDKVSLQVIGDSSGAAPWRTLRESMKAAKLEPVPVLSPTIFFTRAADGTPSLDVSELKDHITTYLDVTATLRAPVEGAEGDGGGGGGGGR